MKRDDLHPNTYEQRGLFVRFLMDSTSLRLDMSAIDLTKEQLRLEAILKKKISEEFRQHDLQSALDLNDVSLSRFLTDQVYLFRQFQFFRLSGRNIVYVEPVLCELFNQTEVAEVVLSDLKWPYDRFYVHWGHSSQITYSIHSVIGAYVNIYFERNYLLGKAPLILEISLVSETNNEHRDSSQKILAQLSNDPVHSFSICADPDQSAGDALKWDEELVLSDSFSTDDDKNWTSCYPAVARLLVNTLCYITDPGSDITEERPSDTPTNISKKISDRQNPKIKNRAESHLDSMGYSMIKVCGKGIQANSKSLGTGHGPRPHWRRGHWRHQRFGKGLSVRKLVWIKPVLVAKDKGSPDQGHIYRLEK